MNTNTPDAPPAFDPTARRPVWDALSTLFLDTDTSLTRPWRVRQLAASPFSVAELEAILLDEVHPACAGNLLSIAGEWVGFDPEWLERRIRRAVKSPFQRLRRYSLGRRLTKRSAEWAHTKAGVAAFRRAHQVDSREYP